MYVYMYKYVLVVVCAYVSVFFFSFWYVSCIGPRDRSEFPANTIWIMCWLCSCISSRHQKTLGSHLNSFIKIGFRDISFCCLVHTNLLMRFNVVFFFASMINFKLNSNRTVCMRKVCRFTTFSFGEQWQEIPYRLLFVTTFSRTILPWWRHASNNR